MVKRHPEDQTPQRGHWPEPQAETKSASKGFAFLNWLTPMMLNPIT